MSEIVLVTGGNRGIGLEICRQLAKKGSTVILTGRNRGKADEAASSIDGPVTALQLDVTDQNSINDAAEEVVSRFGRLDVLINNAGIGTGTKGLADAGTEEIRVIMEANFFGPMMVTHAFLPLLLKSEDARIINISSGMGQLEQLTEGYAGYRLSKAGLNAQTILLSNELRDSNIRVNAVSPGWVRTEMGGPNADRSVAKGAETPVWLATAKGIPNGVFLRDKKVIMW